MNCHVAGDDRMEKWSIFIVLAGVTENSADWIYFFQGIMLQLSQWEKLKNYMSDIDEAIEELNG